MQTFRIRPLTEADLDGIIVAAGGTRAHPDADRRTDKGADYLLGEALIELKALDDEGMDKPQRREKLAELFGEFEPRRPVVVIDQARLPENLRRRYDRIMEKPIKGALDTARLQLRQSASEFPDVRCRVLMLVNNGYTALNPDELKAMVAHRVRQDTKQVDAVVMAGVYYYGDEFESFFVWPFELVPINDERPFASFECLRSAWNAFLDSYMKDAIMGRLGPGAAKGPVIDLSFEFGGVTYVKPAPQIGQPSPIYGTRRPRLNALTPDSLRPFARFVPDFAPVEWRRFSQASPPFGDVPSRYAEVLATRSRALQSSTPSRPVVPIPVEWASWTEWEARTGAPRNRAGLNGYVAEQFNAESRRLLEGARELVDGMVVPDKFVLAVTEEIGQDCANDVSHVYRMVFDGTRHVPRPVAENLRIQHPHAVALAAVHAIAWEGRPVFWQRDTTYGWV